jgi:hypothetical protein
VNVSLSSIAQGAMTAAVSVGSSLQAIGSTAAAAAAQAMPVVSAGGAQVVGQGASAVVASIPQALPASVQAGATTSARLAADLAAVEKPAKAMASATRASLFVRTAGFLSKALPVVTIGAGVLAGAKIVDERGPRALLTSKDGRGAALSAVGGALLLVPHPATQLAAAGVLAGVAVNQFGGLDRFDDPRSGAAQVQTGGTSPLAQAQTHAPAPAASAG